MKPDFTDKKIGDRNNSSRGSSFCLPFFCLLLLLAPLTALHAADAPQTLKPNIIYILVDDMEIGRAHV